MSHLVIDDVAVEELARAEGVCARPIVKSVTDRLNGETVWVPLPCGATRDVVCPACAAKARRLRMTQCLEGWHLDTEPEVPELTSAADEDPPAEDEETVGDEIAPVRQTRSTRRPESMPSLPFVPVENRTIGRAFTGKEGRTYRPSMFVTLTLPSYGAVVPGRGVPVTPAKYDYRRAALDALLFPRLIDRWVQNLRRCAGYKVQYFGAVEAQVRLAPHFHVALRGAIPRKVIQQVTRATYASVWWPPFDRVVYRSTPPVWDGADYVDPDTSAPLRSWEQALDALGDDARPAHTLRFGRQLDIQGLLGGSTESDRAVRYLTKYLTKAVAETYAVGADPAYEAHIDRLHRHVRWLPCSPECANWLRYGVQPKNPGPGLAPGRCPSRSHDREHLGVGGRRVLVSRGWSGKTLSQHRADRATVVRELLESAGITPPEATRMAAEVLDQDGEPRFLWSLATVPPHIAGNYVMNAVMERRRWRAELDLAKSLVTPGAPPVDNHSAAPATGGE